MATACVRVGWYSKKEIWGTSDLTYDILSKYLLYFVHWNYYYLLAKPKKTHALMRLTFTADGLKSYDLSNFFTEKYPLENTLRVKDTFDK